MSEIKTQILGQNQLLKIIANNAELINQDMETYDWLSGNYTVIGAIQSYIDLDNKEHNICSGLIAISINIPQNYATISKLYVCKDKRNKGIGTSLVKAAIDFCKEKNIKEIETAARNTSLNVFKNNQFKEHFELKYMKLNLK